MTHSMSSASGLSESALLRLWPLALVTSVVSLQAYQLDSLSLLVPFGLVVASIWYRGFWEIALPCLICFTGLEKTVFFDPTLAYDTPLNPQFLPDLWLTCFTVRAITYWLSAGTIRIKQSFLLIG